MIRTLNCTNSMDPHHTSMRLTGNVIVHSPEHLKGRSFLSLKTYSLLDLVINFLDVGTKNVSQVCNCLGIKCKGLRWPQLFLGGPGDGQRSLARDICGAVNIFYSEATFRYIFSSLITPITMLIIKFSASVDNEVLANKQHALSSLTWSNINQAQHKQLSKNFNLLIK